MAQQSDQNEGTSFLSRVFSVMLSCCDSSSSRSAPQQQQQQQSQSNLPNQYQPQTQKPSITVNEENNKLNKLQNNTSSNQSFKHSHLSSKPSLRNPPSSYAPQSSSGNLPSSSQDLYKRPNSISSISSDTAKQAAKAASTRSLLLSDSSLNNSPKQLVKSKSKSKISSNSNSNSSTSLNLKNQNQIKSKSKKSAQNQTSTSIPSLSRNSSSHASNTNVSSPSNSSFIHQKSASTSYSNVASPSDSSHVPLSTSAPILPITDHINAKRLDVNVAGDSANPNFSSSILSQNTHNKNPNDSTSNLANLSDAEHPKGHHHTKASVNSISFDENVSKQRRKDKAIENEQIDSRESNAHEQKENEKNQEQDETGNSTLDKNSLNKTVTRQSLILDSIEDEHLSHEEYTKIHQKDQMEKIKTNTSSSTSDALYRPESRTGRSVTPKLSRSSSRNSSLERTNTLKSTSKSNSRSASRSRSTSRNRSASSDLDNTMRMLDYDFSDHYDLFNSGAPNSPHWLLHPMRTEFYGRKCLVLDLDETLVHSSFKYIENADFIIPVEIDMQYHNVYVVKRPGVDDFLKRVGQLYEIVVFTASVAKYGDPLLDQLDIHHVVQHRLFRESCYNHQGNYVKDLSKLGRPLQEVIIIDNSPSSYIFQPQHAVPISSWFSDVHDSELLDIIPFLEDLASNKVKDVSKVLDISFDA